MPDPSKYFWHHSCEGEVRRRPLRRFYFLMALAFALALAGRGSELWAQDAQGANDIAVVVNADNPISDISVAMLRKILLGEMTTWKNHATVVLALRPEGTPERDTVLRIMVGMNSSQFKQHWMGKVFRGEATVEPLTVASKGTMLEYLGEQKGGVGFIAAPKILPHIKILTVNGLKPGDPSYPLH